QGRGRGFLLPHRQHPVPRIQETVLVHGGIYLLVIRQQHLPQNLQLPGTHAAPGPSGHRKETFQTAQHGLLLVNTWPKTSLNAHQPQKQEKTTGSLIKSDQILSLDGITEIADGQFSFSERVGYLKKYGAHSQSFSTLQAGMQYFDVPGIGYIAYMRKWAGTFVLSDPVSAPEHFPVILERFHQKFPNACYIQVSKTVVDFLHLRFGLFGTQFGSESRIDLRKWSLGGKKKQILRAALNQAEKTGITVRERFSDDHTREISGAWIRTRKCKSNEIRFLIRPMEMDYRENERHLYAYQDGKAVGFIYFDPVYRNNEIVSYVPNISRANADFRQGIFFTLMAHVMQVFKEE